MVKSEKVYKCDDCEFTTKYKNRIVSHQSKKYKCNEVRVINVKRPEPKFSTCEENNDLLKSSHLELKEEQLKEEQLKEEPEIKEELEIKEEPDEESDEEELIYLKKPRVKKIEKKKKKQVIIYESETESETESEEEEKPKHKVFGKSHQNKKSVNKSNHNPVVKKPETKTDYRNFFTD
jgi:hypothetical protein